MKINIDEDYINVHNNLCKMSKQELVDLVHNYWVELRSKTKEDSDKLKTIIEIKSSFKQE
jgi:hypothetical protein